MVSKNIGIVSNRYLCSATSFPNNNLRKKLICFEPFVNCIMNILLNYIDFVKFSFFFRFLSDWLFWARDPWDCRSEQVPLTLGKQEILVDNNMFKDLWEISASPCLKTRQSGQQTAMKLQLSSSTEECCNKRNDPEYKTAENITHDQITTAQHVEDTSEPAFDFINVHNHGHPSNQYVTYSICNWSTTWFYSHAVILKIPCVSKKYSVANYQYFQNSQHTTK